MKSILKHMGQILFNRVNPVRKHFGFMYK